MCVHAKQLGFRWCAADAAAFPPSRGVLCPLFAVFARRPVLLSLSTDGVSPVATAFPPSCGAFSRQVPPPHSEFLPHLFALTTAVICHVFIPITGSGMHSGDSRCAYRQRARADFTNNHVASDFFSSQRWHHGCSVFPLLQRIR